MHLWISLNINQVKTSKPKPFLYGLISLSLSVCMWLWSGCIHNWTTTHHGTAATPTHEPNQNTNSSIKLQNISSFSIIFNTPIANHHGNQTTTRRRTYIYYYWYGLVPPDINALNFLLEFCFCYISIPLVGYIYCTDKARKIVPLASYPTANLCCEDFIIFIK